MRIDGAGEDELVRGIELPRGAHLAVELDDATVGNIEIGRHVATRRDEATAAMHQVELRQRSLLRFSADDRGDL